MIDGLSLASRVQAKSKPGHEVHVTTDTLKIQVNRFLIWKYFIRELIAVDLIAHLNLLDAKRAYCQVNILSPIDNIGLNCFPVPIVINLPGLFPANALVFLIYLLKRISGFFFLDLPPFCS